MKTPMRILVTGVTALAVFAASFGIARAMTHQEDTGVDAAMVVPESVTTNAPVLAPVQGADLSEDAPTTVSPEAGTQQITYLADAEDGSDQSDAADGPQPGVDVLAAAAALDSSAGEVTDVIAHPEASPSTEPAPSPGATGGEGSPASDPCADEASADCPAGLAATLFGLTLDTTLLVTAHADPVTSADQGDVAWCPATAVPAGSLRLGAFTSEAATVTIDYWPTANPSHIKHTSPAVAQHWADGSTRYCGRTDVLEEGSYDAVVTAQTADDRVSDPRMFHFDSRGRPTIPTMQVVPLGGNWLWVGVKHSAYQTAAVRAFAITDGADVQCGVAADDHSVQLRTDIEAHTSPVTDQELANNNWDPQYSRSTSALFYAPPGTTARVCGLTFNGSEPSWDRDVAERVETATAVSPNTWEAVMTLRSVSTFRPGGAVLRAAGSFGGYCGRPADLDIHHSSADELNVTISGAELCRLAGQSLVLSVQTSYTKDDGHIGHGTSRAVIPAVHAPAIAHGQRTARITCRYPILASTPAPPPRPIPATRRDARWAGSPPLM